MAVLGVALAVQSGQPPRWRILIGRGLALAVGTVALGVLIEYGTGGSLGIDRFWFGDALGSADSPWPGRPSITAAGGFAVLSGAVASTRLEQRWARAAWPWLVAAGALIPGLAIVGFLLGDQVTTLGPSFALGIAGAVGLALTAAATITTRPDRPPLAWLSRQPDPRSLILLLAAIAATPMTVAAAVKLFQHLGAPPTTQWTLAVFTGTLIIGSYIIFQSAAAERVRVLTEKLRIESARVTAELDSAARYMTSIMPTGLSGVVTVQSRYVPAQQLGGDCFGYGWIDNDHLQLYLIDVSGHGVESALLAASVHNKLRVGSARPRELLRPELVLSDLNRHFQMENQGDHFFTIWYGVYQASTRRLRYCAAGAPPALCADPGTDKSVELPSTAPPIGALPETEFTASNHHVPSGCRLVIFSDGAYEFTSIGQRPLEVPEFERLVENNLRHGGTLDDLVDQLRTLSVTGTFDDDCSLVQVNFDCER